jgi:hypothetical protein
MVALIASPFPERVRLRAHSSRGRADGIGAGCADLGVGPSLRGRHVPHRVQPPPVGLAFERYDAPVVELDTGPVTRSLTLLETSTFAWLNLRRDACADVDGDTAYLLLRQLALARVHACANLETELSHAFADRPPAVDPARRPVSTVLRVSARLNQASRSSKPCRTLSFRSQPPTGCRASHLSAPRGHLPGGR